MHQDHSFGSDVLPEEQKGVPVSQQCLYTVSIRRLEGCAPFVVIKTFRFIYTFPSMLPSAVTQVQVLHYPGQIEVVVTAQIKELRPVKRPSMDRSIVLRHVILFILD